MLEAASQPTLKDVAFFFFVCLFDLACARESRDGGERKEMEAGAGAVKEMEGREGCFVCYIIIIYLLLYCCLFFNFR